MVLLLVLLLLVQPAAFRLRRSLRFNAKRPLEAKEGRDAGPVPTVVADRVPAAHMTVEGQPAILDGLAEGALVLEAVHVLVLNMVESFDKVGKLHAAHGARDLAAGGVGHLQVGQYEAAEVAAREAPLLVGDAGLAAGQERGGRARAARHREVTPDLKIKRIDYRYGLRQG